MQLPVSSQPIGMLVGLTLGGVSGGWLGAVIGLVGGYLLDRGGLLQGMAGAGAARAPGAGSPNPSELLFEATFLTLGHLCKADGRVTEDEIRAVLQVMDRMSLGSDRRRAAMDLFRTGKSADFAVDLCLANLAQALELHPELKLLFLEIMIYGAFADGSPSPAERRLLQAIAERLSINGLEYARAEAQVAAAARHRQTAGVADDINSAYRILGIAATASDAEVTRAYRRLMSRHHPDKLLAKGMPPEMIALANEHTHQVRSAYEQIREARGLRS
jgi:DnaJ like chaperone protein